MEINKLNENELVLWSKPKKIKEHWYNAILERPEPVIKSNIQFIMKSRLFGAVETSYIVVSKTPLSLTDINNINLNEYIFDNQTNFSKGLRLGGAN